jgi:hypothetical protein
MDKTTIFRQSQFLHSFGQVLRGLLEEVSAAPVLELSAAKSR